METLNFRLNLNQSETSYSFEDVQVKISEHLTVTIEGNLEIEFDSEQGFTNPDNLEYFVDTVEIDIQKIWLKDEEVSNLSDEFMNDMNEAIESSVRSFTVESH